MNVQLLQSLLYFSDSKHQPPLSSSDVVTKISSSDDKRRDQNQTDPVTAATANSETDHNSVRQQPRESGDGASSVGNEIESNSTERKNVLPVTRDDSLFDDDADDTLADTTNRSTVQNNTSLTTNSSTPTTNPTTASTTQSKRTPTATTE